MPRTNEQNELIRNERIESLKISALYLFASKGYDATTLDEIANDAGCSHGLIYHYFKNKQEIYRFILYDVAFPMVDNMVYGVDLNQSAKAVMVDILSVFVNSLKSGVDQYSWAINILLNIDLATVEGTKAKRISKDSNKKVFNWVYTTIERGKLEGDFNKNKNTTQLVVSLLAIIKGLAYSRMRLGYKKYISPEVDILMGMLY